MNWRIAYTRFSDNVIGFHIVDTNGSTSPVVESGEGWTSEQLEQHARLIAAAPELLDCLDGGLEYDPTPIDWIAALLADYKTLREIATEAGVENEDPDSEATMTSSVQRFLSKARAAIATAKP